METKTRKRDNLLCHLLLPLYSPPPPPHIRLLYFAISGGSSQAYRKWSLRVKFRLRGRIGRDNIPSDDETGQSHRTESASRVDRAVVVVVSHLTGSIAI